MPTNYLYNLRVSFLSQVFSPLLRQRDVSCIFPQITAFLVSFAFKLEACPAKRKQMPPRMWESLLPVCACVCVFFFQCKWGVGYIEYDSEVFMLNLYSRLLPLLRIQMKTCDSLLALFVSCRQESVYRCVVKVKIWTTWKNNLISELLYSFSMTTVTHYCKLSDLKQHKCIHLMSAYQKTKRDLTGLKSRCL